MPKKPVLTPELIEAGVQKNATEYRTRLETMRAMMKDKTYNPPVDPTILNAAANEASKGAMGSGPALPVYNQGGVIGGDVRLSKADPDAVSQAKSEGKRRGKKEADNEEGQGPQDGEGHARVQARESPFGLPPRAEGEVKETGDSHRAVNVWAEESWEADSEEEVRKLVPPGAKAIEVRMNWKATALVRQG